MYPNIQVTVDVGDDCQLLLTVQTQEIEKASPLADHIVLSKFERLVLLRAPTIQLSEQHRASVELM